MPCCGAESQGHTPTICLVCAEELQPSAAVGARCAAALGPPPTGKLSEAELR